MRLSLSHRENRLMSQTIRIHNLPNRNIVVDLYSCCGCGEWWVVGCENVSWFRTGLISWITNFIM